MEYLLFHDFRDSGMGFYEFYFFCESRESSLLFHDFRDSGAELYEFHNFRDARME